MRSNKYMKVSIFISSPFIDRYYDNNSKNWLLKDQSAKESIYVDIISGAILFQLALKKGWSRPFKLIQYLG